MKLRIAPLLPLLAACAAPAAGERFVYFEASYGCGAAADLGCGLALQPVLTRLDALEGVAESRVAWDGLTLRLELQPGADDERVAAAAAAVLEGPQRRIAARDARDVERWFGAECCLDLSLFEAGVLAREFACGLAAEAQLDAPDRERLEALLHADLERAFRQAHAAGGGVDRLWEQVRAGRQAFEQRLLFLDATQRDAIARGLDAGLELLCPDEGASP